MAQRKSGYERQPNETYISPPWILDALAEHVRFSGLRVWEPCAADGTLARAIEHHTGVAVEQSDLVARPNAPPYSMTLETDFRTARLPSGVEAICTNPPYGGGGRTAVEFIERGLQHLRAPKSRVRLLALLLSVDFDSASTRTHLFSECPEFSLKVVLLKRIRWFEGPSGPSTNHGWYVWQKRETSTLRPAALAYAPKAVDITLNDL